MSQQSLDKEGDLPERKTDTFKTCLNEIIMMLPATDLDKEALLDKIMELGNQYNLRVENLKANLQKQVEINSKLKKRNVIEYDSDYVRNLKDEIVTLKINLTDYSALEKKYYKLLDEFFNLRMANQARDNNHLTI